MAPSSSFLLWISSRRRSVRRIAVGVSFDRRSGPPSKVGSLPHYFWSRLVLLEQLFLTFGRLAWQFLLILLLTSAFGIRSLFSPDEISSGVKGNLFRLVKQRHPPKTMGHPPVAGRTSAEAWRLTAEGPTMEESSAVRLL